MFSIQHADATMQPPQFELPAAFCLMHAAAVVVVVVVICFLVVVRFFSFFFFSGFGLGVLLSVIIFIGTHQ